MSATAAKGHYDLELDESMRWPNSYAGRLAIDTTDPSPLPEKYQPWSIWLRREAKKVADLGGSPYVILRLRLLPEMMKNEYQEEAE